MALSTGRPPPAVQRGRYVFTSSLDGLARLPDALASAGATLDDVVHVGIAIADRSLEAALEPEWLELFPGGHPARRVTVMRLPGNEPLQVQATALLSERRTVFVSPAIEGRAPDGVLRDGTAAQIEQVFRNARILLEDAGGSLDDVVHCWVFTSGERALQPLVEQWLDVFPVHGDRPARKTFLGADLPAGVHVQLQLTARIGGGKRSNWDIAELTPRDPIPLAARVGELCMTSGVSGIKPDPDEHTPGGIPAAGFSAQLFHAFANLETLMAQQGGTLENVGHLGVLLSDFDRVPAVEDAIAQRWPDQRRPAVQWWGTPVPSATTLIQLYGSAVF